MLKVALRCGRQRGNCSSNIRQRRSHWLQDPKWSKYREAFVPVDITPDEKLPERLITAIKRYEKPFEGIMAVSDARLAAVARVAEQLGFSTNPADSYDIAGDSSLPES